MIIYLPLLIAVIGLLLFMFCDQPPFGSKISEVGRIMFFVGLFIFFWHWASVVLK